GDTRVDEATLRALYLPPYKAAVDAGAQCVMVSFSSWNGVKMHANKYPISDVLKGELGFKGFVVSDWGGIDQISGRYDDAVVTAINSGVDMNMVPSDYARFVHTLDQAVQDGRVTTARIDDAVRRILKVKLELGLFEHPYSDPSALSVVGSPEHRAIGRQAVRESAVLLKNDNQALPLAKDTPTIFVAGVGANDIGMMSGGWTDTWRGRLGDVTPGTTILQAIQQAIAPGVQVQYSVDGAFESNADVGIVVVGEKPYAEGLGDRADLALTAPDAALVRRVKEHVDRSVVILISGRPLVVTDELVWMDALVAAWLPGTEGEGIADVLFGDYAFTGKLPYSWPRSNEQLPFDFDQLPTQGCAAPLYPFGYGLDARELSPSQPRDCPTD
ncbi:MAG: glycoside hydrolase family 3 C-terminal domain-containing protein, partial [Chloroflexi bacterium]|nr:glycoside hydrolase family 3 C-terminal domain-containing protein [Chloroflexota bacterium]